MSDIVPGMVGAGGNLSGLSATLQAQFFDWVEARKPQEEEMTRAYNDMMRIWRDDDTKDSGTSKAQKSRVFVGSTRSKIRSARAKIKDSLFGNGKLPFDTKPVNEQVKNFSDTMEAVLEWQLEEAKWKDTISTGVDSIATYGTGFIFGPFVRQDTYALVSEDDSAMGRIMSMMGKPRLKETNYKYDCPYWEHAHSMDCYADPEGENEHDSRGIFWATKVSPEFLKDLKGKKGYDDAAIDRALNERVPGTTSEGSDRTRDSRMNMYRYTKDGRIWFVRYFGLAPKAQLNNWRSDSSSDSVYDETQESICIMAGGYVIKADKNPYKSKRPRPVRRCVYEAVEHEMWGVGVAKNNDPNQRVINAAFRLFIEGKAFALLKMCSIDRSKFEASEDFKFYPGKRFMMKPQLTPEERMAAIIWHDTPDVTAGWETLIEIAERFSDDDTAITKYTQGDDSKSLNDTATGISMIMNASSIPMKEVLDNIDEMWIEETIEQLIDWNMENLSAETVKTVLGDKHGQMWAQILEYGKTNFMEWFATGSKTFMMKEVLINKLNGFLQIVSGNPLLAEKVDIRELLEQVWSAGQVGGETPVYDEETLQKMQSQGPNQMAQQAIQEVKQQASEAIKKEKDRADKAERAAEEAKRQEGYNMAKLRADEHNRHIDTLMSLAERGLSATKMGADIDLVQAQTVKTLEEAAVVPDQALAAAAAEKEPVDG